MAQYTDGNTILSIASNGNVSISAYDTNNSLSQLTATQTGTFYIPYGITDGIAMSDPNHPATASAPPPNGWEPEHRRNEEKKDNSNSIKTKNFDLKDGQHLSEDKALDAASEFLGKGYKDIRIWAMVDLSHKTA